MASTLLLHLVSIEGISKMPCEGPLDTGRCILIFQFQIYKKLFGKEFENKRFNQNKVVSHIFRYVFDNRF